MFFLGVNEVSKVKKVKKVFSNGQVIVRCAMEQCFKLQSQKVQYFATLEKPISISLNLNAYMRNSNRRRCVMQCYSLCAHKYFHRCVCLFTFMKFDVVLMQYYKVVLGHDQIISSLIWVIAKLVLLLANQIALANQFWEISFHEINLAL